MSMYICSQETFEAIACFVFDKDLDHFFFKTVSNKDRAKKVLATRLYNLNVLAFEARYKGKPILSDVKKPWILNKDFDPYVVKDLVIDLQYQCAEGKVPKMKLFHQVSDLLDYMEEMYPKKEANNG